MLLLARGTLLTNTEPPAWVISWLQGREHKREATSTAAKVPDLAAQSKREADRITKVTAGIEELRLFFEDVLRRGLSDPTVKTYTFWDRIAARMGCPDAANCAAVARPRWYPVSEKNRLDVVNR